MRSPASLNERGKESVNIRLFSAKLQVLWTLVLCITVVSEVIPIKPIGPAFFYAYVGFKVLLFLMLGFLTPLVFWRFDSIGMGVLLSFLTAGAGELMQSVSKGHRASYVEFGVKVLLLSIGFALGLNTRYNGVLRIGPFRRYLVNTHQRFKD